MTLKNNAWLMRFVQSTPVFWVLCAIAFIGNHSPERHEALTHSNHNGQDVSTNRSIAYQSPTTAVSRGCLASATRNIPQEVFGSIPIETRDFCGGVYVSAGLKRVTRALPRAANDASSAKAMMASGRCIRWPACPLPRAGLNRLICARFGMKPQRPYWRRARPFCTTRERLARNFLSR
jgi:hypothetical protein